MQSKGATSRADLTGFVQTAKKAGVPDDALVALLRHNGWSERRVYAALTDFYEDSLGLRPPGRSGRDGSAREAFLYLLNFITLAFWTIALGQLFYAMINRAFPDRAIGVYYSSFLSEIAFQLATIIVAFPAFLVIRRFIGQELQQRPEAESSPVRLWLTYVALVLAAIIVLSDGIWFLAAFLQGQLTIRFVLDSLVLLVLGGGVFTYYLSGLQKAAPQA